MVLITPAGITRLPILEGEVSHVEIPRTSASLGVTIVGGSDTPLRCCLKYFIFVEIFYFLFLGASWCRKSSRTAWWRGTVGCSRGTRSLRSMGSTWPAPLILRSVQSPALYSLSLTVDCTHCTYFTHCAHCTHCTQCTLYFFNFLLNIYNFEIKNMPLLREKNNLLEQLINRNVNFILICKNLFNGFNDLSCVHFGCISSKFSN